MHNPFDFSTMLPKATFKKQPEDFVVEELDSYPATGNGVHTFVRIRKTNLNTEEAIRRICTTLSLNVNECGYAGLKDKYAIATQRISIPNIAPEQVLALSDRWNDLHVLEVKQHSNKLKPGHLKGNRFTILLRDVSKESISLIQHGLEHIATHGFPNIFGSQRFGHDNANAQKALAFIHGTMKPPRNLRLKRLLFSALQARWFNQVLAIRVADQSFAVPQHGDILKKHTSGGLFLCENEETDRARAQAHEVSPTGPMFGLKMTRPSGKIWELEQEVLINDGIDWQHLASHKALGDGTRRSLRAFLSNLQIESRPNENQILIQFELPKGCYATTVLSQVANIESNTNKTEIEAELEDQQD